MSPYSKIDALRRQVEFAKDLERRQRREEMYMWLSLAAMVLIFVWLIFSLFADSAHASSPNRAIVLAWSASPSVGVSYYRVYRGSTNGGPYTAVASVASLSFRDTNVKPNRLYYYVVTAYCNSCSVHESAYSNQASAVAKP